MIVLCFVVTTWAVRVSDSSLAVLLLLMSIWRFALAPLAMVGVVLSGVGAIQAVRERAQLREILFSVIGLLLNGVLLGIIRAY